MSERGPLREIVERLERAGIPHMLAGSFASTYHGEPRTTNDVDFVIDPTADALDRFVRELDPERYYVSVETARAELRRRGQFNVISLETGWKVDLIFRKERPFSREEFARRTEAIIDGVRVSVATAEDTILAKLEWAKLGESDRQIRDVVGILRMLGPRIDSTYVERWVRELDLGPLWTRARVQARNA